MGDCIHCAVFSGQSGRSCCVLCVLCAWLVSTACDLFCPHCKHCSYSILFATAVVCGTNSVAMFNIDQIVESIGVSKSTTALAAGLYEAMAACGRLSASFTVEFLRLRGTSRMGAFLAIAIIMTVAQAILILETKMALFVGYALSGLVYGAWWTLVPILIADLYGLRYVYDQYQAKPNT